MKARFPNGMEAPCVAEEIAFLLALHWLRTRSEVSPMPEHRTGTKQGSPLTRESAPINPLPRTP